MPTPKKGARLGGSPAHQRLILANLATALFEHGRITTTEAKARVLRPVAEKLITKAKKAELGIEGVFAATSLHTLVQMISSGLGVSFLPAMVIMMTSFTRIIVVLGIRIFGNAAAIRRRVFRA